MPEPDAGPVLRLRQVRKHYGALRPLRINDLAVAPGQRLSLIGLDLPAAETFVSLATGAALPDEGTVEAFGRGTASITDSADWLAVLDRFGVLSDRVVLLEAMTVAQNLAVPFTLEIDPLNAHVRPKVDRLAVEVGLQAILERRVAELSAGDRARIRLARALALGPGLLILEHPTASLPSGEVAGFARLVARVSVRRQCAVVSLTADGVFARALGGIRLVLEPATGGLRERSGWFRPWRTWRR